MSHNGQKLPRGTDASRGARRRQRPRNSVEEVEDLLQHPYPLDQRTPEGGSSASSLLPHAPGAGVPGDEPPVYCPPYSFPPYQSGVESGASDFYQPNSYDTPYVAQEDGSLVSGQLYLDDPAQATLYQGASSSDEPLPYVPNLEASNDNSYFYPDPTMPPTHAQPFMAAVMPGSDSSGPGLDGAAGYSDSFSLDGRVQQPLDSQGQHLLYPTGDITNWTQQCMDQTMEGLSRCSSLGAAHEPEGDVSQGGAASLSCQVFGFAASTAQAGRGGVPPPSRRRRGREKKPKLYELGQQENEEEEMKRVRASKQKEYREKVKKEKQAEEARLAELNQEISELRLESEQRGERVRHLEALVGHRNLGL